ncbi:MAG: hypothetical protein QGI09_07455 [Dehalococcoidia bacterium]|nr:hypothetical protein [Dehalococcoidia bacterium]
MIPTDTIRKTLRCGRSTCPCKGARANVHCPAHDDATPSLSVSENDGRTLFHCYAGCSQDAVIAALQDKGLLEVPLGNGRPAPRAVEPHISKVYDYIEDRLEDEENG